MYIIIIIMKIKIINTKYRNEKRNPSKQVTIIMIIITTIILILIITVKNKIIIIITITIIIIIIIIINTNLKSTGKRKDPGSTPRFGSPFSSKNVLYGRCLVTLS